ncbi:MAG: glycine cleavage system protein H [Porphyromonadaceae bacterium]|nr:MAG: glycine cleavage system protein H [Porphyromonadaceae bacterium]
MENFSRIDIFDTKGIEYIFVIGYLLILIFYWKVSNKEVRFAGQIQKVISNLSASLLRIPQGLFYNPNHAWTHLDESGTAKVGMDDFLQHVVGEIKFANLKNPGETIKKGDLLTEIVQNGKRLQVFSPISGKIINTNVTLSKNPELVNEDPYGKGWIYQIKPANWMTETSSCYLADEATKWTTKELERFKDFLTGGSMKKFSTEPFMVLLQDGGELRDNILSELPDNIWKDFQIQFLNSTVTEG